MSMTTHATSDFGSMSNRALAATLLELAYEWERRYGTEAACQKFGAASMDELERRAGDVLDRPLG